MTKTCWILIWVSMLVFSNLSAQFSVTLDTIHPTCLSGGSASVIATGGSNYTYQWSDGATTDSVSQLVAGSYSVTVYSDGGLDSLVSVFTFISPTLPAIAADSVYITNASCGQNNGSVTGIEINGGRPPYDFKWKNNGGTVVSAYYTLDNVPGGTYTFAVTDANGCNADTSITISSSPAATAPLISADVDTICTGDLVSICPEPQTYIHYDWNTGDTTACIINGPGNYQLAVIDSNGCAAISDFTMYTYPPLSPAISVSGDTLTATGGSNYQWYLDGQPLTGVSGSVYVTTQSGIYTVQVTDSHGCYYNSDTAIFDALGLNNMTEATLVKVFPNPLSDGNWQIMIDEQLLGASCEIMDAGGQVVIKMPLRSVSTNMCTNFASGIYTIQIVSEKKKYNLKLIKL